MKEVVLGINLIGPVSVNAGLGVIVREYARAMLATGIHIAIFDSDSEGGRSGHDLTLQEYFVDEIDKLPYQINIWVLGGPSVNRFGLYICARPQLQSKLNVAFVWWETPDLPFKWTVGAQAFDAIIGSSEFICQTWANSVSSVPVIFAPVPLSMPSGITRDRSRFALPSEPLLVYMGFEPISDPVRKNPFAAVEAFRRAFPVNSDVRLVIKINNPDVDGKLNEGMKRLYAMIAGDKRVILLTDSLSYKDTLTLYASCDIIISMHRAEGLGLMPLEAMRLAKPVIATGWSGNMTYMNQFSAAIVKYKLVAPDETATHYSRSALGIDTHWAEPCIDHAAAWLKALANDRSFRESIGNNAKEHTIAYDKVAGQLNFVKELKALMQTRYLQPAKDFGKISRSIAEANEPLELGPTGSIRLNRAWRRLHREFDRRVRWRFR